MTPSYRNPLHDLVASATATALILLCVKAARGADMPQVLLYERASVGGLSPWATSGAVTVSAGAPRNGNPTAFKIDASNPATTANMRASGVMADAGRRCSFWVNFPSLNPSASFVLASARLSDNTAVIRLNMTTSGIVSVTPVGGAEITGSVRWQASAWTRVAWSYYIASATDYAVRLYINGKLDVSINGGAILTNTGTLQLLAGQVGNAAGVNFFGHFDEFYVDNGTDLGDPGLHDGKSYAPYNTLLSA